MILRSLMAPGKTVPLPHPIGGDDHPDYPRILFMGNEPPSSMHAGSIYFYRLLASWPAHKLHVVTHRMPGAEAVRLSCSYTTLTLPLDQLNRTRLAQSRLIGRLAGLARWARIEDQAGLRAFRPQLVVAVMLDSVSYEAAAHYARSIQCPFVIFVHDFPGVFEPLPSLFQVAQFRADRRVLHQSRRVISVSDGMKRYIADRYDIDSDVVYPPFGKNVVIAKPAGCAELKRPGRLTLGYAGGLHYGYGEQMELMVPALRNTGTSLEVFGAAKPERGALLSDASDIVRFHGSMKTSEEAWRQIVDRCDAVLLPYRDPPGDLRLHYQTHFPSKLADMARLGLPILAVGPPDASGIGWCGEVPGSALCVTDGRQTSLEAALESLKNDHTLRVRLATQMQARAAAFDQDRLHHQFRAIALDASVS